MTPTREQVTVKSTFLYVSDDKPWLTGRKVEIVRVHDPSEAPPDFLVKLTNGSGMTGYANLEDLAETPEAVDEEQALVQSPTPSQLILDLVKTIGASGESITGRTALGFAFLLHEFKLDPSGQWGNAYFRCPGCGSATDCDGDEDWYSEDKEPPAAEWGDLPQCGGEIMDENDQPTDEYCEAVLKVANLRLSEGWVARLIEGED